MYLDEFYDYKERLMYDLLTDDNIVRLITDGSPLEDPHELVYTQVFPFEYLPQTVEHGQTFICCDVDIQKSTSKLLLLPTLYIWVFSHRSKLVLPSGGVRVDKLCSMIDNKIDGSRFYGLGELELYSSRRFAPMTDYQGKVLTYNAVDIKRVSPTGKQIPSNRKAAVSGDS